MNSRMVTVAVASTVAMAGESTVRRWQQRWGATDEEVAASLPGDDLVAEPADEITRAISIDATADEVWRWVVQLGADRGGFYSYDWLENLFRLGIHSADEVVADWQHRAVGDLVYADAAGSGGWYVMRAVPGEVLVLKLADVSTGKPAQRDERLRWEFLWTFAIKPQPGGTTRLLVRERVGFGSRLTRVLISPFGWVSFVMTRKMMRGIKQRAELGASQTASVVRS